MQEVIQNIYSQGGAMGLLLGFLFWTVQKNDKTIMEITRKHTEEREVWRKMAEDHHTQLLSVTRDTTSVLHELKSLIHSRSK